MSGLGGSGLSSLDQLLAEVEDVLGEVPAADCAPAGNGGSDRPNERADLDIDRLLEAVISPTSQVREKQDVKRCSFVLMRRDNREASVSAPSHQRTWELQRLPALAMRQPRRFCCHRPAVVAAIRSTCGNSSAAAFCVEN